MTQHDNCSQVTGPADCGESHQCVGQQLSGMCVAARCVMSPILTPVRHPLFACNICCANQMAPKRGRKRPKRPAASPAASHSDSDDTGVSARASAAAAAAAAPAVQPILRRNSTRLAAAARGEQPGDRDFALAMARDRNSALTDSDDPPEAVEVAAQRDAEHSDDSDADRREPANSTAAQRRAAQCAAAWTEQPQPFERAEFQAQPLPSDAARKPVEWFRLFLDAAAMATMVEATNRRLTVLREERVQAGEAAAADDRRVRIDLISEMRNTSEPELLSFIGILLVMGVVHMENVENYWDLEWGYKPVFEGWPRRRWQALMAALSVGDHAAARGGDEDEPARAGDADNSTDPEMDSSADHVDDAPVSASAAAASAAAASAEAASPYEQSPRDPERRFAGLRSFVDRMNANFARAIGDPGPELCIDERMIRARHQHPAIQLMPKKPIKLGFKSFLLACCDGYVLSSALYPGKAGASPEAGLTANVVLRLMLPYRGRWWRVVTDQWYTGVELALALYQMQITTVGTIRADRKLVPSQLRTGKAGEIKVLQHRTIPALHLIGFYKTAKKGDRRLYLSTSTAAPGVWRERVRPTAADYKQRNVAAACAAALAAAAMVPFGAGIAAAAPVAAAALPAPVHAPVFGARPAAGPAAAAAAAATAAERTLTAAVDRVANRAAMAAFYGDEPDPQLVMATAAAVATAKSAVVDAKRSADVAAVTRTPLDAATAANDAVRRDAAIARVTVAAAEDAQHKIPAVAAEYNRRMGRLAAMNTPWRKSRDWRHCIIVDYIYTAVSNAYLLMRARQPQDDAVRCGYGAFVLSLARELINGYTPRQRQRRKLRVTHDRSASLAAAAGCVVCYRQQKVLHAHGTSADRVGHRTTKCCSGCGIALCKTLSCLLAANKQRPCVSATDTDPTDSDAF